MQLTNFAVFTLLGLASAAPSKRTVAQIQSALSTISTQLDTVDGDIKSFTGSIFQALPLLTAVNTLESDITSATSTVTSTGALSAADSSTILSAVSALGSKIATVLSDAEAKHAVVASAGFTSIVHDALGTLKSDTDAFLATLESTIDSSLTSKVTALQATVDSEFNNAIAEYSS